MADFDCSAAHAEQMKALVGIETLLVAVVGLLGGSAAVSGDSNASADKTHADSNIVIEDMDGWV